VYGPGLQDGTGYLGDEDNGQMSAWFVFSALGFYPAAPGHPEYAIGSPLFTRATIRLANGKRFIVSAPNNSDRNIYIQRATLNGRALRRNYLTHSELMAGGELQLEMGPAPSSWGSGPADLPSSVTRGDSLPERLRDQTLGGTFTASSESSEHAVALAFDDDSRTEWTTTDAQAWVACDLAGEPRAVQLYTLTSGAGAPASDPASWTLEASEDGVGWRAIDSRRDQSFAWRHMTRVFEVTEPTPARHYRLRIDANHGASETHLAEVELLSPSSE
jgi:hypothetical protein